MCLWDYRGELMRRLHLPFMDYSGTKFVTGNRLFLALFTTLIICSSGVSSESTNLIFSGGISSSEDVIRSESLDVSKDGELIAIGYRNYASVIYQSNHSTHSVIEVNAPILDIKFSDDDERIAFSVNNIGNASIGLYIWDYKSSELQLINTFNVSSNPRSISWFNNSQYVIIADGNQGAKALESVALDDRFTMSDVHDSPVSTICANSEYVVTGDDLGIVRLWDDSFTATNYYFDLESGVIHCEFNPQSDEIGILTSTGKLYVLEKDGTNSRSFQLDSAEKFDWSENGENIRMLVNGQNEKKILELKAEDFSIISSTSTFSNMRDFVVIEDQSGKISQIFIATDSQEVGYWSVPMQDENYGLPGADLDGDGIPDSHDEDDDGDGIIDQWDFNCPAQDETCAKIPNEDTIRNVQFFFNETELVLVESFTVGSRLSADIRNISRKAVVSNKIIEPSEYTLFENSICSNLDAQGYAETWIEMMELSSSDLVSNNTACSVTDGMKLIAVDDFQTSIVINFKSSFNYTSVPQFPAEFTITGHPPAQDGSIIHVLAISPMAIEIDGDLVVQDTLSPFWISDLMADFTLNAEVIEEKTFIEKMFNSFIEYPILLLIPIAILVILAIISLRKYNQTNLNLDSIFDEEDIEDENLLDSNIEDYDDDVEDYEIDNASYPQTDYADEKIQENTSENTESKGRRKRVVRKKESTKSSGSLDSNSHQPTVRTKRKKVSTNLSEDSNDEPTKITKKRKLKSEHRPAENLEQTKIRKRTVKTENLEVKPTTRRVRKVSKQVDEMDLALKKLTSKVSEEE